MEPQQIEIIHFNDYGIEVPIRRDPTNETYLALQPPEALPYVVAPRETETAAVVEFVQQRLATLLELREDMLKHYKKTKSLKCHFKTGDVAYLIGRPFMLRVNPLSSGKKTKEATRTRIKVRATMHSDFSLIDLNVAQTNDYDQGRAAFFSYAKPVFARNIQSLLKQCMARVFPEQPVPEKVESRPMREAWVRFNEEQGVVWFSESLIPYPADAIVYTYLVEAIKRFAPEADEEERQGLLEKGVPNWQEMKALLADANNRYAL